MGARTDIMHDFASQEIKRLYSSYDGWTLTSQNTGSDYDTLYQLNRFIGGHREIVRILATYKKQILPGMLEGLKMGEKSSDGTVPRYQFVVIAPANADTSGVPAEIRIHAMQSFTFDGDNLTWVKKPVVKPESAAGKQAA